MTRDEATAYLRRNSESEFTEYETMTQWGWSSEQTPHEPANALATAFKALGVPTSNPPTVYVVHDHGEG